MRPFSLFNCYIDISDSTALFFREFSQEEDILFLPELNSRMFGLFLAVKKLCTVLSFITGWQRCLGISLIDEFRDTSGLQWKNLFPWWRRPFPAEGHCFRGDKKQAIYRFQSETPI